MAAWKFGWWLVGVGQRDVKQFGAADVVGRWMGRSYGGRRRYSVLENAGPGERQQKTVLQSTTKTKAVSLISRNPVIPQLSSRHHQLTNFLPSLSLPLQLSLTLGLSTHKISISPSSQQLLLNYLIKYTSNTLKNYKEERFQSSRQVRSNLVRE